MPTLSTADHSRDSAGMTYVYPVVSRRSRGLSVGVNLNPNNACNWRCVYCQVPGLTRGSGLAVDLLELERELRTLLEEALHGEFFDRYALPLEQRAIRDIALSGNGEPTSSPEFDAVIGVIGQACAEHDLFGKLKLVLISNGSLMSKPRVQRGLAHWSELSGEVWFKLDSATEDGIYRVNNVHLSLDTIRRNLQSCARLCPTWIQTCLFALDGQSPSSQEQTAYLNFLACCQDAGIELEGVLLYGLARPSRQAEAGRLVALPAEWLERFGERIQSLGLPVRVHP